MTDLTFTIEPNELLGLNALATIDETANAGPGASTGSASDAAAVAAARTLFQTALAGKLTDAGLPWAPSAESVRERVAEAAEPAGRSPLLAKKLRRIFGYILAVAALVVLWGGYSRGWGWTGFQANRQLWDWLQLLLVPVVAGTIPLWFQYRHFIGRGRTVVYAALLVAWTGFVIAGYLIPLRWTGFQGQTLWNWFQLLLVPIAVACTVALISKRIHPAKVMGMLRPHHKVISGALVSGWMVTVIGGYGLRWAWTGYSGNTLWDWLQLLLLPLVFPTILLPMVLKWVTGNAAERASQATAVPAASEPASEPASEQVGEQPELAGSPA